MDPQVDLIMKNQLIHFLHVVMLIQTNFIELKTNIIEKGNSKDTRSQDQGPLHGIGMIVSILLGKNTEGQEPAAHIIRSI